VRLIRRTPRLFNYRRRNVSQAGVDSALDALEGAARCRTRPRRLAAEISAKREALHTRSKP
jgi:hypothetical protein